MKSYADALILALCFAWLAICVGMVLLGAGCSVYDEPAPCGRAHPGGGVTVRYAELAEDGGEHD